MDIAKRLSFYLDLLHLSQNQLAIGVGVSQPHISNIIKGKKKISLDLLEDVCAFLGISLAEFFSDEAEKKTSLEFVNLKRNFEKLSFEQQKALERITALMVPIASQPEDQGCAHILGAAAAGQPLIDEADINVTIDVPRKYCDSNRYLIFQARGDSMVPKIPDGAFVVVERESVPADGEIAVVRLSGQGEDEYTIKKIYIKHDTVELRSLNKQYPPLFYDIKQIQSAERVCDVLVNNHK